MSPAHRRAALLAACLLAVAACGGTDHPAPPASPTTARPGDSTTATAPETSGFAAFGDSGGGPGQPAVAAAIEQWAVDHRVDALVTTGDNVYDHGEPELFDDQLDEPYSDLRAGRPMWVTLGNHDVERGYGDEQLGYLGLPELPYARRLPGVHLLFLDGNRLDPTQVEWLEERLSERGPSFRIVVVHQPPYACSRRGGVAYVERLLVPVVERHAGTLVLSGHEHLYQRFTSSARVTYVVTGGGGKSIYAFRPECSVAHLLDAHAEEFHFVGIEIRGEILTGTAVSVSGDVLDRFEVRR